jgi:hypothetical protein
MADDQLPSVDESNVSMMAEAVVEETSGQLALRVLVVVGEEPARELVGGTYASEGEAVDVPCSRLVEEPNGRESELIIELGKGDEEEEGQIVE